MAITRQKKEEILQELVDKFSKSKSIVFADYRGLNVAGISELRTKLREGNAEMKISKKTLIKLAAKEISINEINPAVIEGPVAVTFSYEDSMSGIKILFNFAKDNKNLKLLGGIIDGKVVSPEVIKQYATLPGREELLAKFMGSINAPTSGFVGILNSLVSGLVRVLGAYKDTLPSEEAVAPAKKEPAEAVEPAETATPANAEEKPAEAVEPATETADAEAKTDTSEK